MSVTNEAVQVMLDAKNAKINHLREVLAQAELKLRLYRKQHNGEYIGGMEFQMLMDAISAALNP